MAESLMAEGAEGLQVESLGLECQGTAGLKMKSPESPQGPRGPQGPEAPPVMQEVEGLRRRSERSRDGAEGLMSRAAGSGANGQRGQRAEGRRSRGAVVGTGSRARHAEAREAKMRKFRSLEAGEAAGMRLEGLTGCGARGLGSSGTKEPRGKRSKKRKAHLQMSSMDPLGIFGADDSLSLWDEDFGIGICGFVDPKQESRYRKHFRDTLVERNSPGIRLIAPFASLVNLFTILSHLHAAGDRGTMIHSIIFLFVTGSLTFLSWTKWSTRAQKRIGAAIVWIGRFAMLPVTIQTLLPNSEKAHFFMMARTFVGGPLIVESFPEHLTCTLLLSVPGTITRIMNYGSQSTQVWNHCCVAAFVLSAGSIFAAKVNFNRRRHWIFHHGNSITKSGRSSESVRTYLTPIPETKEVRAWESESLLSQLKVNSLTPIYFQGYCQLVLGRNCESFRGHRAEDLRG